MSIGGQALHILEASRTGRVHSVYTRAINVEMSRGLVCLVSEAEGKGPLNINVRIAEAMTSLGLAVGDPAKVNGMGLEFGELAVSYRGAERYAPGKRLAAPVVAPAELGGNLESAKRTGLLWGNLSGLGELLAAECGRMAEGLTVGFFALAAARRIDMLVEGMRSGDYRLTKTSLGELIGLGPGLTPAADDMLAGLTAFMTLYSENSGRRSPGGEALARALRKEAMKSSKTTALSKAFLVQAAEGNVSEPVVEVCEALLTGSDETVSGATRRLIAVGETSGTDALLGVVLGGELCLEAALHQEGPRDW